jgi:TolB protein
LPVDGGTPTTIDTGTAIHCNNDHGISPDSQVAGDQRFFAADHKSSVYVVPIGGGTPRRVTKNSPSYWHGWSPDGKTLAFVGQRNGDFDIYTIPFAGGDETRLTTAKGLDDGPEYSPDGKYIYFNSERTGHMQIWRMHAMAASRNRSRSTTTTIGFRTSLPTASGWSSSRTGAMSWVIRLIKMCSCAS